ncbi:MAG: hypothetical protein ACODAD_15065 [Planctomycetota bacterium]
MSPRDHGVLMGLGDESHPDPAVLDLVGVRYLVLPADVEWPDGVRLTAKLPNVANVSVWQNPNALPRTWLVHQVEHWPIGKSATRRDIPSPQSILEKRLHRLLYPEGWRRDFRKEAVVESRRPIPAVSGTGASDRCRIVEERANRLEIKASLASPGLLVLSNRYDPGWSVEVISAGSSFQPRIVRANVVLQGVFLPSGTHRLVFRYTPSGFHLAATLSIAGWLLCVVWGVTRFARRSIAGRN